MQKRMIECSSFEKANAKSPGTVVLRVERVKK